MIVLERAQYKALHPAWLPIDEWTENKMDLEIELSCVQVQGSTIKSIRNRPSSCRMRPHVRKRRAQMETNFFFEAVSHIVSCIIL